MNRKSVFYNFLVFFVFMFSSTLAIADDGDIPSVVFRADTRAPSDIFTNGFQHWGNNDSVIDHVSGISPGVLRSSYFIATSSSREVAVNFLNFDPRVSTFWLYEIRANNRFWSANTSLREINTDLTLPQNVRDEAGALISSQNEWLGAGAIPATQIISATQYVTNNSGGPASATGVVLRNDAEGGSYHPDGTMVNSGAYIQSERPRLTENVYLVQGGPGVPFCNNSASSKALELNNQNESSNDNNTGSCEQPLQVSTDYFIKIAKNTYWDSWKQGSCSGDYRVYNARLMNIPGDWDSACKIAPSNTKNMPFNTGRTCSQSFSLGYLINGEYGVFNVLDKTCSDAKLVKTFFEFKGSPDSAEKLKCQPVGHLREYKVKLWNINGSWEDTCIKMPFILKGDYHSRPDYCVNQGGLDGEYGHYYASDSSCP